MAKEEYAEMNRQELETELRTEAGNYRASTGVKGFGYVLGSIYGAAATYNLVTEDMEDAGKFLLCVGLCFLGVKLMSYFQKNEQKKITEIKSAMGNLEARVEE